MIQAYLIDGLAGIALLIFTAGCAVYVKNYNPSDDVLSWIVLGSGIMTASVSLVQAGFQQVLSNPLAIAGEVPIRLILVLVNSLDTFKLLALMTLSLSVSISVFRNKEVSLWIGVLGVTLAITLFLGGLSYIADNSILGILLFFSLPLLLSWVATISWKMNKLASDGSR